MSQRLLIWLFSTAVLLLSLATTAGAEEALTEEQIDFFESKIRPILVERCYKCHSVGKKQRGGLSLDTRDDLRGGGDSGPAIVPGDPDASLLITAVRYRDAELQMPPTSKLPDHEIAALVTWVKNGAPDPRQSDRVSVEAFDGMSIEEGRKFWSFQPVSELTPGKVDHPEWIARKIDAFILEELDKEGLDPSPRADRRTLIRRVSLGLLGVPPTPEQVEDFLNDDLPDAYERVLERFLASPRHGEKWARFWLDKVRYTDRLQSWEKSRATPWRYRDWVIAAFNKDLPYDEFVRRQFAADLMPSSDSEDLAALGLLGLSPTYWKELKLDQSLVKAVIAKEWEERVDVLGRTFLGLTLACARCHDHKFDPVKQTDYYAIAGVIASSRPIDRALLPHEEWDKLRSALEQVRLLELERNKVRDDKFLKEEEKKARYKVIDERTATAKASVPDYNPPMVRTVEESSLYVFPDGESRTRIEYRRGEARDLNLHLRGNPSNTGPLVRRRFVSVLSPEEARPYQDGSGRLELAESIVGEAAPLAARVIVNRIWEQHFGQGLVDTPSNFGVQGSLPTHPRLLDDLSARFIAAGWSLKWLHREIMLSSTFQQVSVFDEEKYEVDPANRLLWRMNRRRLDFEVWRDAMLAVAGVLKLTVGGEPQDLQSDENVRRTVYAVIDRRNLDTMLRLHDFPDPASHSPRREPTTTPVQQLFALNSVFMSLQAKRVYERLQTMSIEDPVSQVEQVYQWLFNRAPTEPQAKLAREFLAGQGENGQTAEMWQQYLHALLSSNEFAFVD